MYQMRNAYKTLVGEPEGNRPLGRVRRRWEDNIRMDLTEIGWEGVNWMHLDQGRDQWQALVNTVMNLQLCPIEFHLRATHHTFPVLDNQE
jgi:hypothetical protein